MPICRYFYGSDGIRTRDLRRDRPSRAQQRPVTDATERCHLQGLFSPTPPALRMVEPIVQFDVWATSGPRNLVFTDNRPPGARDVAGGGRRPRDRRRLAARDRAAGGDRRSGPLPMERCSGQLLAGDHRLPDGARRHTNASSLGCNPRVTTVGADSRAMALLIRSLAGLCQPVPHGCGRPLLGVCCPFAAREARVRSAATERRVKGSRKFIVNPRVSTAIPLNTPVVRCPRDVLPDVRPVQPG